MLVFAESFTMIDMDDNRIDEFEDSFNETEDIDLIADDRTESEKASDAELDRLDSFFAQLQPGARLLIERVQPSWCAGLLEEVTISSESLTLDYFIEMWGGHVLSVKPRGIRGRFSGGSYQIPLHSYPPKVYGEIITKSSVMDRLRGTERTDNQQNPNQIVVNPQTPRSSAFDKFVSALPTMVPVFLKWMEQSAERRQREMLMMMKMMNPVNNATTDITKVGAALVELQKTFGAGAGGASSGDITDFIPQALGILESVLKKPDQSSPRISGATPALPNVRPIRKSGNQISGAIASMAPKDAATTIIEALGTMQPEKRQAAISEFMSEFQNTMGREEEDDFSDEGTND